MIGVCLFCKKEKELTRHHIIAQSYKGKDNPENLIPNVCRDCHDELERGLQIAKGLVGAGRDSEVSKSIQIGVASLQLQTGSVLLDNKGTTFIDTGSPIYGMRLHNKLGGERNIEACLSGSCCAVISGAMMNSWVVYSITKPY